MLVIIGVALVSATLWLINHPLQFGDFGTGDFIQYWASWRVLAGSANPYNGELLRQVQATLSDTPHQLIYSWNPPWTFLLLSPILILPFSYSAGAWLILQVVFLLIIGCLAPRALKLPNISPLLSLVTLLLFFPTVNCLLFGQLGIALALSVTLFLFFEGERRFALAGLALVPLTSKPHLFFLFVVPGIIWLTQLQVRDRSAFIRGALGGLLSLITLTVFIAPESIANWLAAFSAPERAGAPHVSEWLTTTASAWLRLFLRDGTGGLPQWPLAIIPLFAFTVTILYFERVRERPIIWREIAPLLLCLSLATTSYGWIFDQSVLLLVQFTLISRASLYLHKGARIGMMTTIFGIQLASIFASFLLPVAHHDFAWLPWALVALLFLDRRVSRTVSVSERLSPLPFS